jgi:hypothetical protein
MRRGKARCSESTTRSLQLDVDDLGPKAGSSNPRSYNPGTDDPETDDPETDDPETDDPETDDPGTDDPETDDPGTTTRGQELGPTDHPTQRSAGQPETNNSSQPVRTTRGDPRGTNHVERTMWSEPLT